MRRFQGVLGCACLSASVVTFLAIPPATARAGEPFRFDWPVPCRVGVTSITRAGDVELVLHSVMHLYRTSNPNELKAQVEDLELWDAHLAQQRVPPTSPILAPLLPLMSYEPATVVTREGKYLRTAFDREALSRVVAGKKSPIRSPIDSVGSSFVQTLLRSQDLKEEYESDARTGWDTWVGAWTGLDLEPGSSLAVTLPVCLVPGELIERALTVTHIGFARADPHLVGISLQGEFRGEEVRRSMERWLRRYPQSPGDTVSRSLPLLRSAEASTHAIAFVEPRTLRPSCAASQTIVRMEDSNGGERFNHRSGEDFLEWVPPLSAAEALDEVPERGLELFARNEILDANFEFRGAVAGGSRNPDTYAYLAETCRRMDRTGEAALFARRALSLSPRHSFAHQVLASAYDPMKSGWFRADAETTWLHLQRSLEYDSTDGNAWIGLVVEALRRGRWDLANRGLERLVETGFLTPVVLAYGRWTLRDLPESTLLVTNGDMDTYPAWALQRVRSYRPDVAVANFSLLNTSWYRRIVRDRLGVPFAFPDAALDTLAPYYSVTESTAVYPADQVFRGWVEMKRSGALRRPLAIAVTVPEENFPRGVEGRIRFQGPVWMCEAESVRSEVDTTATRKSLEGLNPADFRGPACSARDRSPVRQAGTPGLPSNVTDAWCVYAERLAEVGQRRDALGALDRAAAFARDAGFPSEVLHAIEERARSIRDAGPATGR